ncbi:hypothetical protein AMD27_15135 [Acinetobacter sp. TGL-Y2]|nr:hypothetical protein AMD27_15135 [Acinetobacter sp. TGL-Y2]
MYRLVQKRKMPLIAISRNKKGLAHLDEQALSKELITVTHKSLSKSLNQTVINFLNLDSCHGNNGAIDASYLSVDIKITKNTNSESEKGDWIKCVWEILRKYIPNIEKNINYISITEVESNAWGYNGLTQLKRATTGDKK